MTDYSDDEDEKSFCSKFWVSNKTRQFLIQLSLLLLVFVYAFLGGIAFHNLEAEAFEETRRTNAINKQSCVYQILQKQAQHHSVNETANFILNCWETKKDVRSEWGVMTATLYGFGIITTLGYNRVAPITTRGRIFCMLYGIFGIPFTMIIIANMGQYLRKFAYGCRKRFDFCRQRRRRKSGYYQPAAEMEDPSIRYVTIALFLTFCTYIALGAWLFPFLNGQMDFINGLYYNFLCLTAMDYGNLAPEHGKQMKVRDLLHAVGKKCGVDGRTIDLLDLDSVVSITIAVQEGKEVPEDDFLPPEPQHKPSTAIAEKRPSNLSCQVRTAIEIQSLNTANDPKNNNNPLFPEHQCKQSLSSTLQEKRLSDFGFNDDDLESNFCDDKLEISQAACEQLGDALSLEPQLEELIPCQPVHKVEFIADNKAPFEIEIPDGPSSPASQKQERPSSFEYHVGTVALVESLHSPSELIAIEPAPLAHNLPHVIAESEATHLLDGWKQPIPEAVALAVVMESTDDLPVTLAVTPLVMQDQESCDSEDFKPQVRRRSVSLNGKLLSELNFNTNFSTSNIRKEEKGVWKRPSEAL
ncbi:hypothetical protein L596_019465 [Steinernema carpocapsae]|uniref:Potassium channel domain-containing protein n=1 Tax=Steinernema carpocapsae TaxID=34508 RepID=A0A4U5MQL8_STECR|nr:hypothetical protein L596_019465 [Steinernema carpocapsae]